MKIATTVVLRNNKVLLIKKPTNRYSMPGGKLENFEVPIKTAARETFEETGLVLNKIKLKVISSITAENKKFEMYTFYCDDFDGEINVNCLEGQLEWIDLELLDGLFMYPGDKEIIDYCLNNYELVKKDIVY